MKKTCFKCDSDLERTGNVGEWKCVACGWVWVNSRVGLHTTHPVNST